MNDIPESYCESKDVEPSGLIMRAPGWLRGLAALSIVVGIILAIAALSGGLLAFLSVVFSTLISVFFLFLMADLVEMVPGVYRTNQELHKEMNSLNRKVKRLESTVSD